jgi:hypothetical protein
MKRPISCTVETAIADLQKWGVAIRRAITCSACGCTHGYEIESVGVSASGHLDVSRWSQRMPAGWGQIASSDADARTGTRFVKLCPDCIGKAVRMIRSGNKRKANR